GACCVDAATPFALRELDAVGVEDPPLAAWVDAISVVALFFLDFEEVDEAVEVVSVAAAPVSVVFLLFFLDFAEVELGVDCVSCPPAGCGGTKFQPSTKAITQSQIFIADLLSTFLDIFLKPPFGLVQLR